MIGDSKEQIEQCLNCTKPECTNCLGPYSRKSQAPFLAEHKDDLLELCEEGLTDRQIGQLLGRSKSQICYYRRLLGIPSIKEKALGRAAGV